MKVDFNYFMKDGRLKWKRFPKPKRTVNIIDVSDSPHDSDILRDYRKYSENLDEYNKLWKSDYIDFFQSGYDVEVEEFRDYFDRNINKFLGKLKIFKGNYILVDELFYWYIFNEEDFGQKVGVKCSPEERKRWKVSWINNTIINNEISDEDKIFLKFIELNFIEVKTSSEKEYLHEFIEEDAKVNELNNIALQNNIILKGKKDEKIIILLEALENNLITNTTIDIFRPTEIFDKWIEELQIKYIETIEQALETFDYPEMYKAAVWQEVVRIHGEEDYPFLVSEIEKRPGKSIALFKELKKQYEESKIKRKEEIEKDLKSGKRLIIRTIYDVTEEKLKRASWIETNNETTDEALKELERLNNKKDEQVQNEIDQVMIVGVAEAEQIQEKFKTFIVIFVVGIVIITILNRIFN